MLDVLLYLFEHYVVDGSSMELDPAQDELAEELIGAGFPSQEIDKAFVWLDELLGFSDQRNWQHGHTQAHSSMRMYTEAERSCLQLSGQSLLSRLLSAGVLNQLTHEMVVDRVMALESATVGINHLKWVVLVVLSNQPKFEEIAEWADVIVNEESVPLIH